MKATNGAPRARLRNLRAAGALLALLLAAALFAGGCGAIWTYDRALQARIQDYGFRFQPPDSEAFAPPPIPPVYDVVFTEDIIATRDSLELAVNRPGPGEQVRVVQVVARDTVFVFVPDTTRTAEPLEESPPYVEPSPPQRVRVDLTEGEVNTLVAIIRRDMDRANVLLADLRRSSGSLAEQAEAARGLLHQADSALDQRDYQGAANLARKARVLAESLTAAQP